MNDSPHTTRLAPGFTIVELLIVVVVIAILAAITIVSFNGVTKNAKISATKSELNTTAKQLALEATTDDTGTISAAAVAKYIVVDTNSATIKYKYGTESDYCLEAVNKSDSSVAYYLDSLSGSVPTSGTCPAPDGSVTTRCVATKVVVAYTYKNNFTTPISISFTTTLDTPGSVNNIAVGATNTYNISSRVASITQGVGTLIYQPTTGTPKKLYIPYEARSC